MRIRLASPALLGLSLALGLAALPVKLDLSSGLPRLEGAQAFARKGADDPAGHVRQGRGADDRPGDDRGGRAKGSDDKGGKSRGDDHGSRSGGDDHGGRGRGGEGGKGRGGHDDGAGHR